MIGSLRGHLYKGYHTSRSGKGVSSGQGGDIDRITSHIFLSLVDNKRISAMLLLFLVGLFVMVRVNNYPDLRAS